MTKETELNCAGMDCPKPVIETKNFIENNQDIKTLSVIVDNEAAVENVSRMLKSMGFAVTPLKKGELWYLNSARDGVVFINQEEKNADKAGIKTAVLILSDFMGSGDDELGARLMLNFLATLPEMGADLWRIVLLNGGVKLACQGHKALDTLKELNKTGVDILVCGTCLEHFGLMPQKEIGDTTNMLDVVTSLHLADKVLRV